MADRPQDQRPLCAATPAERIGRGAVAIVLAAVALSATSVWCTVPATLCSACLAFGAITGRCPTDLLAGRRGRRTTGNETNTLGIPDARDKVSL